jgi:phosphonate metabolism protein (transferase hexapeptide repeat family)
VNEEEMKKKQVALGKKPFIHSYCNLIDVDLEEYTEVGRGNFFEHVSLGRFSYTGPYCILQNTQVGSFSNIAAMVRIGPTNHPMERATLHHFTYRRKMYAFDEADDEDFFEHRKKQLAYIGHDTWIGHGAIIMPGVRIGTGAIIGSGAVVTKNIDDYAIAVGVPAKTIKKRYSDVLIKQLLEIQWWDWSYETIKLRWKDFCKPAEEFVEIYHKDLNSNG